MLKKICTLLIWSRKNLVFFCLIYKWKSTLNKKWNKMNQLLYERVGLVKGYFMLNPNRSNLFVFENKRVYPWFWLNIYAYMSYIIINQYFYVFTCILINCINPKIMFLFCSMIWMYVKNSLQSWKIGALF